MQVALLETDNDALSWPWVSRGKAEEGVSKVQAWDVAVPAKAGSNTDLARALAGTTYSYAGIASNAFGTAGELVLRRLSLLALPWLVRNRVVCRHP